MDASALKVLKGFGFCVLTAGLLLAHAPPGDSHYGLAFALIVAAHFLLK